MTKLARLRPISTALSALSAWDALSRSDKWVSRCFPRM